MNSNSTAQEKQVDAELKRIRKEESKTRQRDRDESNIGDQNKYETQTYMDQGLTKEEALALIDSMKIQKQLSEKMRDNSKQSHDGGQH